MSDFRTYTLLPKVAVDEWGFMSESINVSDSGPTFVTRQTVVARTGKYLSLLNSYFSKVQNLLRQANESLIVAPHLNAAKSEQERERIQVAAKEHSLSSDSIRLSVINGIDAWTDLVRLQQFEQDLFGEQKTLMDSEFYTAEEAQFQTSMAAWCRFAFPGDTQQVVKKKNASRSSRPLQFRDLLIPSRNRVKAELKRLKRNGIEARIHNEHIQWEQKPALWITCSTNHPLRTAIAIEQLWYALVAAFEPDRGKITRQKSLEFYWPNIVIVPLVDGRSLEGLVIPHFSACYWDSVPSLESAPWRMSPEQIADAILSELQIEVWNRPPSCDVLDRFVLSYGLLFHHVDHVSDLLRCQAELDDLGQQIAQKYLDREISRLQRILQETLDSCAKVFEYINQFMDDEFLGHDDLREATIQLLKMKEALSPLHPEPSNGELRLHVNAFPAWRDRLLGGFVSIGMAKMLWYADCLAISQFE